ncbi:hypothetical protein LCGC14_0930950 [marine sediment metagenome]|uniref:Uncharacterized protein n=1 Tax=marine sediment metagenome TaxID=412755 RepID=A0A0F9R6H3_9ZZZZ
MAVFHGKAGKVDFSGAITSVLNWALTTIGDIAESHGMGSTWKSFVAGFRDSSATVDAVAYTESTIKVGTNAGLKLYIDATNYFYINTAVCIEQTETVNMNDIGRISYSFVADDVDALTFA